MATYRNKVQWLDEHKGRTSCQNGVDLDFSAPPDLFGLPRVMTPEDAFVMAANTCYHMMVLWAMERFQVKLLSFECEAIGEVEEHLDKTSWFKTVALHPRLVVSGKPEAVVRRALDLGLKYSTICQSLKSEVTVQPTITVR